MKTLQSWTQQLEQWRRTYHLIRSLLPSVTFELSTGIHSSKGQIQQPAASIRGKRPPVVLLLAVVSLTGTMGNRFYNAPKLDVNKTAPQTIRAPYDAKVEDVKTTEEKRRQARTGAVPVLMLNESITHQIYDDLERTLLLANEYRSIAGSFPFVSNTILSASTQLFLRNCSEWEWRAILAAVETGIDSSSSQTQSLASNTDQSLNSAQVPAVVELQNYRRVASPAAFLTLVETINQARQNYIKALNPLSHQQESKGPFDSSLLDLSDEVWQQTQTGIRQAATRILTQGIPPGLPPMILREAVKTQQSSLVPPEAESVVTRLLLDVLKPNLTEDKQQTKLRAEQAAQAVEPSIVFIRQGDVIVHANETITQEAFVLLDHFELSRRGISWIGLIGFGGLICGAIGIFWLIERRYKIRLRERDHLMVLLLVLSTPALMALGVPYINLPAVGLLVSSFYGSALGVTVLSLLSGVSSISLGLTWDYLLASAAGGLMGALVAGRLRSREELALLGGAVGLTQGGVYLILNLMLSGSVGAVWYTVFRDAALYGLGGLAWCIAALGVSPYLEHLFDLVTPIRLAELASPNRPLLKRLAAEAPGTFQHTLFVATLAEAAARRLGCNVELVRAGTLYHDIGKMHDPLGFIENQMGGPNKHDEISDPWKSAQIIKKHVTEGLVMARKCRLPKSLQAFIPEHQGTMLIAYFYHQATQLAQQDPSQTIREEDFRYDGPIPQSRETGIVMLADSCEAALRSLKDACAEQALSMINKILRARWQDNQLVDSGLTREELSIIAEVFVQVWQQYNHQRIAYPKLALNPQRSA